MSHEACSWVAAQRDLTPGEKLLLFTIANRVDEYGIGFPGRERLAAEACCRPETATANMKRLTKRGLLARFERRRPNGSRTSDWLVLAPLLTDRGGMYDAPAAEHPEPVAAVARKCSGEESSGEVSVGGQVRKTGGPEPSEEPSDKTVIHTAGGQGELWDAVPDEMQVDALEALRTKRKVGSRLVTEREVRIAAVSLSEWNRQLDKRASLLPWLERIVRCARDHPSWDEAKHVRLVQSACRLRWWERRGAHKRPEPKVIWGSPEQFERVAKDASDEAAARRELDSDMDPTTKRYDGNRAWQTLTPAEQANVRESITMGYRPWAREDEPVPVVTNGHHGSVNATNFLTADL